MDKITLYSSVDSQWASVPLLGLIEKQYQPEEYEIKEVDLLEAEHLGSDYLKINMNRTIPALVAPDLAAPLIESTDILEYLDAKHKQRGTLLSASTKEIDTTVQNLIELVHSSALETSLFFFGARNEHEMERVQAQFADFFRARQAHFAEKRDGVSLDDSLWKARALENEKLLRLSNSPIGDEHLEYFKLTETRYRTFVAAFEELETKLVLPWATGEEVTYADLHITPWLSHAMLFVDAKNIDDLDSLELWVAKSVTGFHVGPKVRQWWKNMQARESFRKVFPTLR